MGLPQVVSHPKEFEELKNMLRSNVASLLGNNDLKWTHYLLEEPPCFYLFPNRAGTRLLLAKVSIQSPENARPVTVLIETEHLDVFETIEEKLSEIKSVFGHALEVTLVRT